MELAMAQCNLLEHDRNSLILILMEDIDERNLTPRLALQMKTQTYIRWDEEELGRKLFFKKLQRALGGPQKSFRMQTM